MKEKQQKNTVSEAPDRMSEMFEVGAHFGYRRSKTHPSVRDYIFGMKNNTEIIDLEKTQELLNEAKDFVKNLAKEKKMIVFVGGKHSSRDAVIENANAIGMPYVVGRWIGGTITNFPQTKKRINRLNELKEQKEAGELAKKYTKKEQLLFDREIQDLQEKFGGLSDINRIPDALFVIDPKREHLAMREANKKNIPVVALASSDCDIEGIEYPIVANDSAPASIRYFAQQIADAYREGLKEAE